MVKRIEPPATRSTASGPPPLSITLSAATPEEATIPTLPTGSPSSRIRATPIRSPAAIGAGTEVVFEVDNDEIVVRKVSSGPTRGDQLAARLRGRGDVAMTTDEIIALTRGA